MKLNRAKPQKNKILLMIIALERVLLATAQNQEYLNNWPVGRPGRADRVFTFFASQNVSRMFSPKPAESRMNDFLIQNSFRSQWQLNLGFVYIASNDFLIQFLQFSTLVKKRVFEQTPKKILLFCLTFGASSSFSFWPKPAGRPASFFSVFCNP